MQNWGSHYFGIILWLIAVHSLSAQEETHYAYQTFRDTRIVNGHSVESGMRGEMKFIISHRFGELSRGSYELFGLDLATIRYGLDYGITNNWDVGLGRSSFQKTIDGYVKHKFLSQSTGARKMPISATIFQGITVYGLKWQNPELPYPISNRLTYVTQLTIARKFSPAFSLQLASIFVHRNYVQTRELTNDLIYLGIAAKTQVSKVTAISIEYFPKLYGELAVGRVDCISVGIEFQTKGHVFQIHFSNSQGMVEPLFLTETTGKWSDMDIMVGFNITRDFKIGTKKF